MSSYVRAALKRDLRVNILYRRQNERPVELVSFFSFSLDSEMLDK